MLDAEGPLELVPTYLGAHAIAPEFKGDAQGYTDLLCRDLLPRTCQWWLEHAGERPLPFVDVFCETGAFDLAQSRQILSAAKALGFPLKIHADEFDNLGGASLAVELGAASADHLVKTSAADIAALGSSDTVAVALPCTPFGLAEPALHPGQGHPAGGRNPGHGLGYQPRHGLVREHAVRHRPGLPLFEIDPGPGRGGRHHQRRPGHPPGGSNRLAGAGQAGGRDHLESGRLPPPGLPFWHQPGANGH